MAQALAHRSPVDLPGPEGDNSIAREPLWYAYATGTDRPEPPAWTWTPTPPPDTHVAPAPLRTGARTTLPLGTAELLRSAAYPAGRISMPVRDDALGHALVATFGPVRREPGNPYNDHRSYASARCLFPVHAFVEDAGRWRLVQPGRHALADHPGSGPAPAGTVALTGRYTAIPEAYKWFRSSLVNLEIGIVLRQLALGLELTGVPARLRLPHAGSAAVLDGLGLAAGEWSLPVTVETGPAAPVVTDAAPAPAVTDPVLADILHVNRAHTVTAAPVPLGVSIPATAGPGTHAADFAELLWERTSGRMPRAMHGMSGRRSRQPARVLRDAAAWLGVPPPGPLLAEIHRAVTVTAAVQDIDGYADGVHRLHGGDLAPHRLGAGVPARLEQVYGYPAAPGNGCDIRHASAVWFLSVRPRDLVERFGPAAWTLAQYVCGWAAHGLCLSAAASGLFARPVRAFKEVPTQHVLGLDPADMIVLAVVTGAGRPADGPLLDLRL